MGSLYCQATWVNPFNAASIVPVIPGGQIADIAGGALNAAVGILMALYHREQTGLGQFIDISMTDGAAALLSLPMFFRNTTGTPFRRGDAILSHRYACYNVYKTADGRFLSIGALENRFWENLCRFLKMPGYGPLQYDDSRRREIIEAFGAAFEQKTLAQWEKPALMCFSDADPIMRGGEKPFLKRVPGARGQPHITLSGRHFIQEEDGENWAAAVVAWINGG
mgnify:CR=1 FL=1